MRVPMLKIYDVCFNLGLPMVIVASFCTYFNLFNVNCQHVMPIDCVFFYLKFGCSLPHISEGTRPIFTG